MYISPLFSYKNAILHAAEGKRMICECDCCRYFSRQELRDLFRLDDPYVSKTQIQLDEIHACNRKTDAELDQHIKFLETLSKLLKCGQLCGSIAKRLFV